MVTVGRSWLKFVLAQICLDDGCGALATVLQSDKDDPRAAESVGPKVSEGTLVC